MTYAVLAPEHPLVDRLAADEEERRQIDAFRAEVARETEIERLATDRPKRGVRLKARAVNPFTKLGIPLFLADYVLMGYGTGAIMAVPAHDERDFAFAKTFGLPIRPVVLPPQTWLDGTKTIAMVRKLCGDPRVKAMQAGQSTAGAETLVKEEAAVLKKIMPMLRTPTPDPVKIVEYLYRHGIELFDECFAD
ncbi:class I tRNA ligase family protein, partial [Nocardia mangyaensis]